MCSGSVWTDLYRSATGHFTQLVWRNTTTVGCARTECNGGQKGGNGDAPGWYVLSTISLVITIIGLTSDRYIVCEYYPAGNVLDQFKDNVMRQEGAASSAYVNMVVMCIALAIAFSSIM